MKTNNDKKEHFEELLILRDKIIEMENEIKNIIEQYKLSFNKRNITSKNANTKTIQNDLIYSALFGNRIII